MSNITLPSIAFLLKEEYKVKFLKSKRDINKFIKGNDDSYDILFSYVEYKFSDQIFMSMRTTNYTADIPSDYTV